MEALQLQAESNKPEDPAIKVTLQRLINKASLKLANPAL